MSRLRYHMGLYGGKAVHQGLKLLNHQASYLPGLVSARLDPDYFTHLPKPELIIAVTGTNGKTTTSNLLFDVLSQFHQKVVNNNLGSNTNSGIMTTLTQNLDLRGRKKSDVAVLEVDERWSPFIFRSVIPDVLIITNLYQDSYKRNAHTDFIRQTLEGGIPRQTRLVLNADDLISSSIGQENERVFFSIAPLQDEPERRESRLKDIRHCLDCAAVLEWDFLRYHHIGRAHCPRCGFTNQEAKYIVHEVDHEQRMIRLTEEGVPVELPLILDTTEAVYNQLAAYSALREFGLSAAKIKEAMGNLRVVESRYSTRLSREKNICLYCAKQVNPIANSRAFDAIRRHPGRKTVILATDDDSPTKYQENLAWLYDADFEHLAQESLNRLIICSWKYNDLVVRALMAAIPEDKIRAVEDYQAVPDLVDLTEPGDIFILYAIHPLTRSRAEWIRNELTKRLEVNQ